MTYYYNADNTLWYRHDAKGQDTVYTYDGTTKRVTKIQQFPTGKNNAEDYCQQVVYTYNTNTVVSGFTLYGTGRLTTSQYRVCAAGSLVQTGWLRFTSPGGLVTEMYSYHPAGVAAAKRLQVYREWTDGAGGGGYNTGSVQALL